jgi:hypothetical protein
VFGLEFAGWVKSDLGLDFFASHGARTVSPRRNGPLKLRTLFVAFTGTASTALPWRNCQPIRSEVKVTAAKATAPASVTLSVKKSSLGLEQYLKLIPPQPLLLAATGNGAEAMAKNLDSLIEFLVGEIAAQFQGKGLHRFLTPWSDLHADGLGTTSGFAPLPCISSLTSHNRANSLISG